MRSHTADFSTGTDSDSVSRDAVRAVTCWLLLPSAGPACPMDSGSTFPWAGSPQEARDAPAAALWLSHCLADLQAAPWECPLLSQSLFPPPSDLHNHTRCSYSDQGAQVALVRAVNEAS